jgi:hypothetical protein
MHDGPRRCRTWLAFRLREEHEAIPLPSGRTNRTSRSGVSSRRRYARDFSSRLLGSSRRTRRTIPLRDWRRHVVPRSAWAIRIADE